MLELTWHLKEEGRGSILTTDHKRQNLRFEILFLVMYIVSLEINLFETLH